MKILLLDIETAPNRVYTWGLWNQNIAVNQIEEPGYTLCWAAKWLGEKEVMFSSLYKADVADMLKGVYDLIEQADAIVHFNGTKFDMPKLMQEFLEMGWPPPSPVSEIDLYRTVKKRFAFPSNKLSYVLGVLGLEGKMAHKGMELWRECMADDPEAWATMEAYNKQDVKALEPLYNLMKPWIIGHPNAGLYASNDTPICPNCGSSHLQSRGLYHAKTQSYNRYRCNDCGKWSRVRTTALSVEKRKVILVGVE